MYLPCMLLLHGSWHLLKSTTPRWRLSISPGRWWSWVETWRKTESETFFNTSFPSLQEIEVERVQVTCLHRVPWYPWKLVLWARGILCIQNRSKSGFWIWDCSNTAFCCWRHSNHRDYIVILAARQLPKHRHIEDWRWRWRLMRLFCSAQVSATTDHGRCDAWKAVATKAKSAGPAGGGRDDGTLHQIHLAWRQTKMIQNDMAVEKIRTWIILNPMANCIMEYDVPVVVQCLLKCCLLFHSGSQKILGGQPHAQRWDRWNWLQSEAQTSNGSAVESDTTERCFVQVRMWRILQRPWWSGPQLHSPLGIHRWGRINDLSYLVHQVSSHFLCHICRIHLHFFAGPNRCMCCMLQVMLIETNIDINAMMCWCKVWEQISSKISILTF